MKVEQTFVEQTQNDIPKTGTSDAFRTAMKLYLKTQFDNMEQNLNLDKVFNK